MTIYGNASLLSWSKLESFGYAGNDYLDGGDGNDYLDGGANDTMDGGEGNDLPIIMVLEMIWWWKWK